MPSCHNSAMCLWSITACRAPCRNRCPLHRERTVGANRMMLLIARAAVLQYRRYFVNRAFPFVWSGFTLLAGIAMLGLWALHCAIELSILDLRNTIFRTVVTIAMFPVASFLLGRAQRGLMG